MATLNVREQRRAACLGKLSRGEITVLQAAEEMGLGVVHVKNLLAKYQIGGPGALAHGNRRPKPVNGLEDAIRGGVVELEVLNCSCTALQQMAEKLTHAGIKPSPSSLRIMLVALGMEDHHIR